MSPPHAPESKPSPIISSTHTPGHQPTTSSRSQHCPHIPHLQSSSSRTYPGHACCTPHSSAMHRNPRHIRMIPTTKYSTSPPFASTQNPKTPKTNTSKAYTITCMHAYNIHSPSHFLKHPPCLIRHFLIHAPLFCRVHLSLPEFTFGGIETWLTI